MTIGIYIITFEGTDRVYIGQSINIEDRWSSHLSLMKKNTAASKLQDAYNIFGTPTFSILEKCASDKLDTLEVCYIQEFNSIDNGFNTCSGGNVYSGVHAPTSVYSKEQILRVLYSLAETPVLTVKEVSDITKVSTSVIRGILTEKMHIWAILELPEVWKRVTLNSKDRDIKTSSIRGTKLSSKVRGIIYPILVDNKGNEYQIENARSFALLNNIHPANLGAVLNGRRVSTGGFKRKVDSDRPIKGYKEYPLLLNTSTGDIEKIKTSLTGFCKMHRLDEDALSNLLSGSIKSHRGWVIKQ